MRSPCRCFTCFFLFVENTSSKRPHSSVCQSTVMTRVINRGLSLDSETFKIKTRGSDPGPCIALLEELRMIIAKRKVTHDGEGPANKYTKTDFDLSDKGNEVSTSSTVCKVTGGLMSSNIITHFKKVRF